MLLYFCILNSPYWTGKIIANVINFIKEHRDRGDDSFVRGSNRSASGIVSEQMFHVRFRGKICRGDEWFGSEALQRHWDSHFLSGSSPLQPCDQLLNSSDSDVPSFTSNGISNEVDNSFFICLDQSVLSMAEKAENLCAGYHAECVAAAASHLSERQGMRDVMLLQCSATDGQEEQNED